MKKKRDFVDRLLEYGAGFALLFLVVTALSISMTIFFVFLALVVFLDRLN